MTRRRIALALLLFAAGCSVPTEGTAQVISQEELPVALQNAPTTTTTTIPNATEDFTYYLLQQRAEQEDSPFTVAVTRPVERGAPMTEKLAPLFSDDFVIPEEEADLINNVPAFDLVGVGTNESDIATVQLTIDSPGELTRNTLRDIAAQLVWTLTELRSIEAILIEVNGALLPIPSGAEGEGDVSEPVRRDNFPRYARDFEFPEAPEAPPDGEGGG